MAAALSVADVSRLSPEVTALRAVVWTCVSVVIQMSVLPVSVAGVWPVRQASVPLAREVKVPVVKTSVSPVREASVPVVPSVLPVSDASVLSVVLPVILQVVLPVVVPAGRLVLRVCLFLQICLLALQRRDLSPCVNNLLRQVGKPYIEQALQLCGCSTGLGDARVMMSSLPGMRLPAVSCWKGFPAASNISRRPFPVRQLKITSSIC